MCLTDEDDVVHSPPKSWLELCASKGICDSHFDALLSLPSAIFQGFNIDSLRAPAKLYVEHSFITENEADASLSDIPVIGETLNHRSSLTTNYLVTQNQTWIPWYQIAHPFPLMTTKNFHRLTSKSL